MKIFASALILVSWSAGTAECITGSGKTLREGNVLTKENWETIDVVFAFDRERCQGALSQELFEVEGKLYWKFRTIKDYCDGGNTYGAVYSYDLKTPHTHIYDGDYYCQEDWLEEFKASP